MAYQAWKDNSPRVDVFTKNCWLPLRGGVCVDGVGRGERIPGHAGGAVGAGRQLGHRRGYLGDNDVP